MWILPKADVSRVETPEERPERLALPLCDDDAILRGVRDRLAVGLISTHVAGGQSSEENTVLLQVRASEDNVTSAAIQLDNRKSQCSVLENETYRALPGRACSSLLSGRFFVLARWAELRPILAPQGGDVLIDDRGKIRSHQHVFGRRACRKSASLRCTLKSADDDLPGPLVEGKFPPRVMQINTKVLRCAHDTTVFLLERRDLRVGKGCEILERRCVVHT